MSLIKAAGLLLGGAAALLLVATVETLDVDSDTMSLAIVKERIRADNDVATVFQGEARNTATRAGNGFVCPGVEAAPTSLVLRNDWTDGNWAYRALIEEASANAWPAGRVYKVELFGDSNLIATLYFKNDTASGNIEGASLRVDTGSATQKPKEYTTIVSRLDGCP